MTVERDNGLAADEMCAMCRGLFRLQARYTRRALLGGEHRLAAERILRTHGRWFLLRLQQAEPCQMHKGAMRLARHLAGETDSAEITAETSP